MIKFEDLKNIRNFSELTIDEYATASVDDISQMLFAEAIRGSRRVVVKRGVLELISAERGDKDKDKGKLIQLLTAFAAATDDEFIEHYLYASPEDRDAWASEKCIAYKNQHMRKGEEMNE